MKVKKRSWQSLLFMVVTILALLMPQTVFATGGTDGTELQVAEPASLEIQLGTDWAGVEFELKTDAGMYPGDVVVGDDGVLRLEIGGSKSYILTCMNSSVTVPDPEQAPATTEESSESSAEENENAPADENTVAGIPTMHLILFGGGMAIAIGVLVGLYVVKRRKQLNPQYQDDDEEDD